MFQRAFYMLSYLFHASTFLLVLVSVANLSRNANAQNPVPSAPTPSDSELNTLTSPDATQVTLFDAATLGKTIPTEVVLFEHWILYSQQLDESSSGQCRGKNVFALPLKTSLRRRSEPLFAHDCIISLNVIEKIVLVHARDGHGRDQLFAIQDIENPRIESGFVTLFGISNENFAQAWSDFSGDLMFSRNILQIPKGFERKHRYAIHSGDLHTLVETTLDDHRVFFEGALQPLQQNAVSKLPLYWQMSAGSPIVEFHIVSTKEGPAALVAWNGTGQVSGQIAQFSLSQTSAQNQTKAKLLARGTDMDLNWQTLGPSEFAIRQIGNIVALRNGFAGSEQSRERTWDIPFAFYYSETQGRYHRLHALSGIKRHIVYLGKAPAGLLVASKLPPSISFYGLPSAIPKDEQSVSFFEAVQSGTQRSARR